MKRRLAMLLALSLSFTMLPAGYASAAETPEAVEMTVEEDVNDDAEAVDETIDDAEAGKTAEDEGTTLVEDTTEDQTEEQVDVAPETDTTEVEPADTAAEEETDEVVTGSTVISTEIAETEEPEVTEAVTDAKAVSSNKKYANKVVKISGKRYGFDENGDVITNSWYTYGGKTYYLGADGAALTGWQTIKGKVFYFGVSDDDTLKMGALAIGKKEVGGKQAATQELC